MASKAALPYAPATSGSARCPAAGPGWTGRPRGQPGRDPDRDAEPQGQGEHIAEAEGEAQPDDGAHDDRDRADDNSLVRGRPLRGGGRARGLQASPPSTWATPA